jgi:glycosyltransferase 2 family protein
MLACVYCILFSLHINTNQTGYIFVFLIAAVASVLPISVGGGLGVREFVMIEGAKYAGLEQHTALLVSLLFYIITLVCSLAGIIFVFKNPLQEETAVIK